MTGRRRLPNRRQSTAATVIVEGVNYTATTSRFEDGRLAELFLDGGGKTGSSAQIAAQDAAILASLLLQYGVTADKILERSEHAAGRHAGRPGRSCPDAFRRRGT